MYTQCRPCRLLSPYIDAFWQVEGSPGAGTRINILPDGCVDFIFTLGNAFQPLGGCSAVPPLRSYFVGPMTAYSELVVHTATVSMLGVRFRPAGLFRFGRLPLPELVDRRVDVNELDTFFNVSFADRLGELPGFPERVRLLETFLAGLLRSASSADVRRIEYAVGQIDNSKGRLPIRSLTDRICWCPRHFERKFKEYTGVSPVKYSRIVRFRYAVDLLRSVPFDNLLSVAVQAGYYDTSHFFRDIRKLSGGSCRSFLDIPAETGLSFIYMDA